MPCIIQPTASVFDDQGMRLRGVVRAIRLLIVQSHSDSVFVFSSAFSLNSALTRDSHYFPPVSAVNKDED